MFFIRVICKGGRLSGRLSCSAVVYIYIIEHIQRNSWLKHVQTFVREMKDAERRNVLYFER